MEESEFLLITLDTLNYLFDDKACGEILTFRSLRCVKCGKEVDIEIHKTLGGYGFLNGIISEPIRGKYWATCSNCNGYKPKV